MTKWPFQAFNWLYMAFNGLHLTYYRVAQQKGNKFKMLAAPKLIIGSENCMQISNQLSWNLLTDKLIFLFIYNSWANESEKQSGGFSPRTSEGSIHCEDCWDLEVVGLQHFKVIWRDFLPKTWKLCAQMSPFATIEEDPGNSMNNLAKAKDVGLITIHSAIFLELHCYALRHVVLFIEQGMQDTSPWCGVS